MTGDAVVEKEPENGKLQWSRSWVYERLIVFHGGLVLCNISQLWADMLDVPFNHWLLLQRPLDLSAILEQIQNEVLVSAYEWFADALDVTVDAFLNETMIVEFFGYVQRRHELNDKLVRESARYVLDTMLFLLPVAEVLFQATAEASDLLRSRLLEVDHFIIGTKMLKHLLKRSEFV